MPLLSLGGAAIIGTKKLRGITTIAAASRTEIPFGAAAARSKIAAKTQRAPGTYRKQAKDGESL